MVFNEGYVSNLDVVDLGPKLHAFVFLATYDRTKIRTVNAHDSILDFLLFNQVTLLTAYLLECGKTLFMFCRQGYYRTELATDVVPLRCLPGQKMKQTTTKFQCSS